MSKLLNRSWWSTLGLAKPVVDDGDDFGDMGTAFGLDASMAGACDGESPATLGPTEVQGPGSVSDRLKRRSTF